MRIHNIKLGNQILSLVLAFVMVISMLPMSSFTALAADATTGTITGYASDSDGDACASTTDCTGTYAKGICSVCGGYQPAVLNEDGVYEISNAGQLYWFAAVVNGGYGDVAQNTSANAVLTENITVNENVLKADGTLNGDGSTFRAWTPIGTLTYKYTGTFDGNNKTVSSLYFNDSDTDYVGLFGYVGNGGTVKNVGVIDSYLHGYLFVGGVVGRSYGTVTNCYNTSSVSGSGNYVGGVVGSLGGSGTVQNCYNTGSVSGNSRVGGVAGINHGTVTNCYNTGSVSSGYGYVGGVAGENAAYGTVRSCYNTGSVSSGYSGVGGVVGVNYDYYSPVTNCYYLSGTAAGGIEGSDVTGSAEAKTAAQFASGEVAYLLQAGQTAGEDGVIPEVWGQNIKTSDTDTEYDAYPTLGGAKVYYGYNSCAETATAIYTNDSTVSAEKPAHSGDTATCQKQAVCVLCGTSYGELNTNNHEYVNGVCACGAIAPIEKNENGVYEIYVPEHLVEFAQIVNGTHETIPPDKAANAILKADIDMTGIDWTPICSTGLYYNTTTYTDKGYEGTFDGGGYTISNLKITGTDGVKASYGLFGTLSGTVKNLGMRGMTFSYSGSYDVDTTDARAGAIAGQMLDGSLISDCFVVDSSLTPNNYIVGGIAGCNYAGTIQNCYTKNVTISAHDRCGNLVSDTRGDISTTDRPGTVKNCYTDASRVVGTNTSGSEYITGCVANILDRFFASGEITYKLNGDRTETVWYQKDGMPAFSGSIVYENTCGGDIFYSTTYTDHENHDLGDDFRCSVCGNYDAPEQDANGVYQIVTPSNLFWFAEEVNKGNTNINAVLTNDIDLNSVQWMPIGNEANPFKGVFDGQNYKIKNLYIHATEGGNYGVFGYLVDGTVKNFSVSGNAVIELSAQEAVYYGVIGAAAARNADTYVTNVHSTVTMEIKDSFNKNSIAGIIGYAEGKSGEPWYRLYIDRCSFGGSMNFGTAYVDVGGGIAGYVNYNGAVYITNCLYDGTITSEYEGAQAVGGIAGYNRGQNMRIQNCLSVGTIELKNTSYAGAIAGRYLVINTTVFTNSKVTNNYYSGSLPAFSNTTDASVDNYNIDIVDFTEYTGNEAVSVTDTQLKSGEVTWLLNGASPDGIWKQTIGAHDVPGFEGATVNLNGTTYENTGNYIYVEITWTAMEFTYISGDWNPETHQYDEGYWWRPVVNNGEVHVTNKGSAVYVSFGYTSLVDGVSGYFDGDHFLEKDESCYSCLTLEGKPTGGSFTNQQIGSITVTISQTPPASFTRWWEVGDTVDHIGKNGKVYSCYIADIRDGKYVLLTKEPEIFTTTDAEQLEALKETQLQAVGATRYPAFDSSKAEYAIYESYALESLSASNDYEQYISLAVDSEGNYRWLWEDGTYLVVIEDDLSTYYENYDIKACFYYIFEVPVS